MTQTIVKPHLELRSLGKRFSAHAPVLRDIHLGIQPGEIVSLIGPSGCGKSTLLRIIAGLDGAHEGEVRLSGRPLTGASRAVGFMFQEPRLLPWLTVSENIAFGIAHLPRAKRRALTEQLLQQVHLENAGRLFPRQLSGGMQQRTALARCLAAEPEVLLLDEPFSALDAFTRIHLQDLLLDLWQRTRMTMVLVTHDIDEALFLSDRVVILGDPPSSISEILSVALPRPRDRSSPYLLELRGHLLEELRLAQRPRKQRLEYSI